VDQFATSFSSPLGVAIIASVLTAFASYMISHAIEYRREKKAKREQREFKERVIILINYDILSYLTFIQEVLMPKSKEVQVGTNPPDSLYIDLEELKKILFRMSALPKSYSELPTETRVKVFDAFILERLEWGYRYFNQLHADLKDKVESRKLADASNVIFSKTDLNRCIEYLRLAQDKINTITLE
jgi:hypothetical protein